MGSGTGFAGGYGWLQRSAYATPAELDYKPWTPDFTTEDGNPAYPTGQRLNPYPALPASPLQWRTEDWDPGLRPWSLPFDDRLTEWLQDVDLAEPCTMAAREFASQSHVWAFQRASTSDHLQALLGAGWLEAEDVAWWPLQTQDPVARQRAWSKVNTELTTLESLMQDDRARYLAESQAQSDGIPRYFMHLLAADSGNKPWTMQLIRCAVAIGNVAYLHYKSQAKRVRPSTLCPGLVPPFGPPQHPAFPSGHAFLGHFIALLLLEVPGIAQRHGVGMVMDAVSGSGKKPVWSQLKGRDQPGGSLLWLAARLALNRERMGLHYASDSSAGRHLAAGIWNAAQNSHELRLPTLNKVLQRARAEWQWD